MAEKQLYLTINFKWTEAEVNSALSAVGIIMSEEIRTVFQGII